MKEGQILPCQVGNPDALQSGFRKSFVPWYSLHLGPYLGAIKNGQKKQLTSETACSPLDSTEGRLDSSGPNRVGVHRAAYTVDDPVGGMGIQQCPLFLLKLAGTTPLLIPRWLAVSNSEYLEIS